MSKRDKNEFGVETTDVELETLARKFLQEGLPEENQPAPKTWLEKIHPYLPDSRVTPLQERMWLEYPLLAKYDARFVTAEIEPPYTGQLPDGSTGTTNHRVCQFIISSEHPRPLQRKMGLQHVSIAIVFKQAWEEAEKERQHYVSNGEMPPLEKAFRMLARKHSGDLATLESII